MLLILVMISGSSNAVNLTDGLDGLAAGACTMVFGAYTLVNIWQNNQWCALIAGNKCYDVRDPLDLAAVAAVPAGPTPAVVGALIFMMTGFGLGWVNAAADYSRYLPRSARSSGVVGWTAFGSSLAPVILLVFGVLLAASSADLSDLIAADPIGALTTILPTWFLVPFAVVAVLGLVGGAVLDIYSSGLALLSAGPLVTCARRPTSLATMWAKVVLPNPPEPMTETSRRCPSRVSRVRTSPSRPSRSEVGSVMVRRPRRRRGAGR